ncbi:TPA: antitoxin Xre/MbcA/ParS toxin-binding domain-containing protein [Vibrio cholerae]
MRVKIEQMSNGEFFFKIPETLRSELQWREGDRIEWIDNKNGSWTLKRVESLHSDNSNFLNDLLVENPALKAQIDEVFAEVNLASLWLTSPLAVLGGSTPLELIHRGDVERVLGLLRNLKYGDFS